MLERLDVFRKIPKDLTLGTGRGAALSILSALLMVVLVFMETIMYFRGDLRSTLAVNSKKSDTMPLYFRMSFPNVPCDALFVELLDYSGHKSQNVKAATTMTRVKGKDYTVRKLQELRSGHPPLKSDDTLGVRRSITLASHNFTEGIRSQQHVFVNFYTPWCPYCQNLAPTWEALAVAMMDHPENPANPVAIAKVNCVVDYQLCMNQMVRGFPTLRLFRYGHPVVDYKGRRTLESFQSFLKTNFAVPSKGSDLPTAEGCMVQLKTIVYAVPGQIYVGIKTDTHKVKAKEVNLTHDFGWLQFGNSVPYSVTRRLPHDTRNAFKTLSSLTFTSQDQEFAHSHYLKLVGTIVEKGTLTGNDIISYQYTATHNGEAVKNHLPEVRISYDISPTVVRIHNNSQRWYEFLTKLCAIVGGFFTVMSLVDSGINNILQRSKKDSMGKLS